jgi:hypothetical protein
MGSVGFDEAEGGGLEKICVWSVSVEDDWDGSALVLFAGR